MAQKLKRIHIIPFGDYYKKKEAEKLVKDNITKKKHKEKMLKLLELVPKENLCILPRRR